MWPKEKEWVYPALARRNSSVGEDKASCMTRMSLADLVAARENVLSQYFQTFLEYTQGLPALVKTTAGSSGIRTHASIETGA